MITILMGKSASGKDVIARELVYSNYKSIVSLTTRPMRKGEVDGVNYNFITLEHFQHYMATDSLIESRSYRTKLNNVEQVWHYGIAKQDFNDKDDYVVILDLKGCKAFINNVGRDKCKVVYIGAREEARTSRAMKRGGFDKHEWERRLVTDEQDFPMGEVFEVADLLIDNDDDLTKREFLKLVDKIHFFRK